MKIILHLTTIHANFSDAYIPTIICSLEDKDDLGASHQNVEGINREHDEHEEKELDLMVSVLVATVLEEMHLFMLQRCCNSCLSMASANLICKCESIDSVLASLYQAGATRHFDFSLWFLLSVVVN